MSALVQSPAPGSATGENSLASTLPAKQTPVKIHDPAQVPVPRRCYAERLTQRWCTDMTLLIGELRAVRSNRRRRSYGRN
jgi:hypothetical protein